MFDRQLRAQTEVERRARGRQMCTRVLEGLQLLRGLHGNNLAHQEDTVEQRELQWQATLEDLGRTRRLVPDVQLREQLDLTQGVLEMAHHMEMWGETGLREHQITWRALADMVEAVSSYLRGDATPPPTERMVEFRRAYELTLQELDHLWKDWEERRPG